VRRIVLISTRSRNLTRTRTTMVPARLVMAMLNQTTPQRGKKPGTTPVNHRRKNQMTTPKAKGLRNKVKAKRLVVELRLVIWTLIQQAQRPEPDPEMLARGLAVKKKIETRLRRISPLTPVPTMTPHAQALLATATLRVVFRQIKNPKMPAPVREMARRKAITTHHLLEKLALQELEETGSTRTLKLAETIQRPMLDLINLTEADPAPTEFAERLMAGLREVLGDEIPVMSLQDLIEGKTDPTPSPATSQEAWERGTPSPMEVNPPEPGGKPDWIKDRSVTETSPTKATAKKTAKKRTSAPTETPAGRGTDRLGD
jgi:hypothetical protein